MLYHSETIKYFLLVSFLQEDTEQKQHMRFLFLFLFLLLFFGFFFFTVVWRDGQTVHSFWVGTEDALLTTSAAGDRDRDAGSDPCICLSSLVTLFTLKVWVSCILLFQKDVLCSLGHILLCKRVPIFLFHIPLILFKFTACSSIIFVTHIYKTCWTHLLSLAHTHVWAWPFWNTNRGSIPRRRWILPLFSSHCL